MRARAGPQALPCLEAGLDQVQVLQEGLVCWEQRGWGVWRGCLYPSIHGKTALVLGPTTLWPAIGPSDSHFPRPCPTGKGTVEGLQSRVSWIPIHRIQPGTVFRKPQKPLPGRWRRPASAPAGDQDSQRPFPLCSSYCLKPPPQSPGSRAPGLGALHVL